MDFIELELVSNKDWVIHRWSLPQAERQLRQVQHKLSNFVEPIDLVLFGESKTTGERKWFYHRLTRGQAEDFVIRLQYELASPVFRVGNEPAGLLEFAE